MTSGAGWAVGRSVDIFFDRLYTKGVAVGNVSIIRAYSINSAHG